MRNGKTILVVDDDYEIRSTLAELLEDEGFTVRSAANGQEALAVLRGEPLLPDLILLDLMMPVMSGWQFREEQLKDPALSAVPVVVLTAGTVGPEVGSLQAAGVLKKPLDLDTLLDSINESCVPA